jgi:hypothetical protein
MTGQPARQRDRAVGHLVQRREIHLQALGFLAELDRLGRVRLPALDLPAGAEAQAEDDSDKPGQETRIEAGKGEQRADHDPTFSLVPSQTNSSTGK